MGQGNQPSQCDPDASWGLGPCCSADGVCGSGKSHCLCKKCVDYSRGYCSKGWKGFGGICIKMFKLKGVKLADLSVKQIKIACKKKGLQRKTGPTST